MAPGPGLGPRQGEHSPDGYQQGSFCLGGAPRAVGLAGALGQPSPSPWEEVGQGMQEVEGPGTPEFWAAATSECPYELQCLVSWRNQDFLLVGFGHITVYLL